MLKKKNYGIVNAPGSEMLISGGFFKIFFPESITFVGLVFYINEFFHTHCF